MLSFHPLTLRQRTPIADDAVCLQFDAPPGLAAAYRFEAGQHLAVRALVDGRELRRTYSIVSPAGGPLRIGVRVQGAMSRYLAEALPIGGVLESLEPTGRFKPTLEPSRAKSYVALAAGSGITPVLSIVGTLLETEPASRVLLVYGNRDIGRAMFLEDILALKDRYLTRLRVQFIMSREPQELAFFNGRLDAARLAALACTEFDPRAVDEYFICGPGSMVRELADALRALGARGRIHFERFGVEGRELPAPAGAAQEDSASRAAADVTMVTVIMDGRRRSFRMARAQTVLEAGEAAGLALPYSTGRRRWIATRRSRTGRSRPAMCCAARRGRPERGSSSATMTSEPR